MKIIKNNLSDIPVYKSSVDNTSDLPYIPQKPLPVKSFLLYIVGSPGSGKTSLMMTLLTSHPTKKNKDKNLYYFKFFDNIFVISGSLQTLPKSFLKLLPEEKKLNKYSDNEMIDIIESLQEGDNDNNLLVLDDVIKDLNRSKILSKIFLNRRHITHNSEMEGQGGLAVIVLSQKFTLLNLEYRNAVSHFILFKTSNASELKRIKEEIMYDLDDDEFNELTKLAWRDKYSFIFVDLNKPKNEKYYIKFDKVVFDNESEDETIEYDSEQ
jgi:Cdc6-like AAA superfamily ATPase